MKKGEAVQKVIENNNSAATMGSNKSATIGGVLLAAGLIGTLGYVAGNNIYKEATATRTTIYTEITNNLTDGKGNFSLEGFYGTDKLTYYFGEQIQQDTHVPGCYTVNMQTTLKDDTLYKALSLGEVSFDSLREFNTIAKYGSHTWVEGLTKEQVIDLYGNKTM